jgi:hypothetical protein
MECAGEHLGDQSADLTAQSRFSQSSPLAAFNCPKIASPLDYLQRNFGNNFAFALLAEVQNPFPCSHSSVTENHYLN